MARRPDRVRFVRSSHERGRAAHHAARWGSPTSTARSSCSCTWCSWRRHDTPSPGRPRGRRRAVRRLRGASRSRCAAGCASEPHAGTSVGSRRSGRRRPRSATAPCACRSCSPACRSSPGWWQRCSSPSRRSRSSHELLHFVKLAGHASSSAAWSAARSPSCSSSGPAPGVRPGARRGRRRPPHPSACDRASS